MSCSDSEYYKVKFENVDRLASGDKVFINGLEVGQVKELILDDDKKILATIWIGQNIKLTTGSTFTIHSDVFGTKHIEIDLSDKKELMNPGEIQEGYIQSYDTTGLRKISKQEYDSLVKIDPNYKLADSLFKTLGIVKDNLDKKNK